MNSLLPFVTQETTSGGPLINDKMKLFMTSIVACSSLTSATYSSPNWALAENSTFTVASVHDFQKQNATESIRDLRRISGLTWEQISSLFDVSRRTVHLWDNGKQMTRENQEKLGNIILALTSFDTGSPVENRRILLTPTLGTLPIDLLRMGDFSKFHRATKFFSRGLTRDGEHRDRSLGPLSPEFLVGSLQDKIHTEKTKRRNLSKKRLSRV